MTSDLLRSIVQGVVSLAVVGVWLYLAATGRDVSAITPAVLVVFAFWFGQSWLASRVAK